jgi:hypothetical protein
MASETEEKKEKKSGCGYFAIGAAFVIYLFIQWIVSSAMEAKTYTRLTGREVSTWDAMWVQLRVQASPEDEQVPDGR